MQSVVIVGLDIAKNVFQAHGIDAEGGVVFRRRITRAKVREFFASLPKCLVGIEACASAHHWAREIGALGHTVKLMPPAYVKAYVKTQKNDSADAEAICEAVTRPNMRFAEVKSVEQQSVLSMHKLRATLIRHRTRVGNSIRAHMAEFGVIAPIGRIGLESLVQIMAAGSLSVIRYAQRHGTKRPWLVKLLERRTSKIAAVALTNKIARMVWALMTKGEKYREPVLQAA